MARPLKSIDRRAVRALDGLAVNSTEVRRRVQKAWQRDSVVIYPPVDTAYFSGHDDNDRPVSEQVSAIVDAARPYLLAASRLITYKRFDMAIQAAEDCASPLVIAGGGPEEGALRRLAARSPYDVQFVTSPSDADLRMLMRHTQCFLFFGHEDFGMVPVEAQATGTPVLAMNAGGTAETVKHGISGALLETFGPKTVREGMRIALECTDADCANWAQRFGLERFRMDMMTWVDANRH